MTQRNYFLRPDQLVGSDRFVLFYQKQVVVRDDRFLWEHAEIESLLSNDVELLLVDEGSDSSFVVVHTIDDHALSLGAENHSLRSVLFTQGDFAFTVAGKASQIVDWYDSHRYCGSCGSPTIHHANERAVNCSFCSQQYYPRINPCAIMLVTRGDQCLLARSARFKTGFFSCLAGFIEVGETPEETVQREVKEEVGLDVENIRYIKSQSWPFPSQLMLGYMAEYKAGEIVPEVAEIAEADWYSIDNLPNVPAPGISVAGELIQLFVSEVRQRSL